MQENIKETYTKDEVKWLINKYEQCSNRYLEAEKFIIDLSNLPWYKRLFINNNILNFINKQLKTYNF